MSPLFRRRTGNAGQVRAAEAAAAEVTPLSQRAAVMMIFRVAAATILTVLAYSPGAVVPLPPIAVAAGFLAASGALSLGVLVPHRPFALRAFGTSLLLDGVFLQYQHEVLGHRLPVDVALSPAGDLVVACHSGDPDWGTGPGGRGRLFKIRYDDPNAPQPVAIWAASPTETWVAFDKPLELDGWKDLRAGTRVEGRRLFQTGVRVRDPRP